MKSARYETVKKYYEGGLWSLVQVKKAVEKGWISAGEYEELTGKKY